MNLFGAQLEICTALLAIGALLLDAFRPQRDERILGYSLALLTLGLFAWSFSLAPTDAPLFQGAFRLDAFALFFKRLVLLGTAFVLVMASEYDPIRKDGAGECYALMLLAATGMMFMISANDLIVLFVSLELVTVSFYILVSYLRRIESSLEAGVKYMVLGAVSGGFAVYGIAFLFGTCGTTRFEGLHAYLVQHGAPGMGYSFGMLMLLAGLGFKLASVPMQIWVPDVYQGAPTPVTAFLASGSKITGFAVLLRLLFCGLLPGDGRWNALLMVLAGLSLAYGSLGGLGQRDIKRLLGYSSIAHAGFLLLGLSASNRLGIAAVLFYLAQYLVTVCSAFLAIVVSSNASGSSEISSYAGLSRRSPSLAAALFVSFMSLAGVPPFSGSFGKFMLLASVFDRGAEQPAYYVLGAMGGVAIVLSLYYYLRVIRAAYVDAPGDTTPAPVSPVVRLTLLAGMAGIIALGLFQRPLLATALALAERFPAGR
jgi:NADH-quinone oxidoreductase subunit N